MLRPMNWPKVSVIISTFERPEMLYEAVGSVLDQTFCDLEIIVVDDGSNTAEKALLPLGDKAAERKIGLYVSNLPDNSGYQSAPKNAGLLLARGTYIAYLDDDNLWDPEHLDVLVTEIEKMGTDAVYSRWRYVGDGPGSGEDFEWVQMTQRTAAALTVHPMHNFIDTSAILLSKSAFVQALGPKLWNEELRRFGDWEMVSTSIKARLRWRGVDRVTFTYRWHGKNLQLTRSATEMVAGIKAEPGNYGSGPVQ